MPDQIQLTTKAETARMLRVNERTLDTWERQGRLRPVRLTDRSIRYTVQSVTDLIERSAGQPA